MGTTVTSAIYNLYENEPRSWTYIGQTSSTGSWNKLTTAYGFNSFDEIMLIICENGGAQLVVNGATAWKLNEIKGALQGSNFYSIRLTTGYTDYNSCYSVVNLMQSEIDVICSASGAYAKLYGR